MIALAAIGDGFFTPVNLIAHSLWRGAPLDGTFDGAALALGLVIHMMVSMVLGVVIIALTDSPRLGTAARSGIAMGIPVAAWAGQLLAWEVVDPTARAAFTPWVLFVGHVMFGVVAAVWVSLSSRFTTPVESPRHSHAAA
jgi:hypothetical protein